MDSARGLVKKYSLWTALHRTKDGEKVDGIEGAIGKEKVVDLVEEHRTVEKAVPTRRYAPSTEPRVFPAVLALFQRPQNGVRGVMGRVPS